MLYVSNGVLQHISEMKICFYFKKTLSTPPAAILNRTIFVYSLNDWGKVVETSNTIGGLLSFQASSGGTGSGFGSLILEEIADRFK